MNYVPTGNEYITLDRINKQTAELEALSVLYMSYKGILEISGSKNKNLLCPYICSNGKELEIKEPHWRREHSWIPEYSLETDGYRIKGTFIAPIENRGFIYRICITNISLNTVETELGVEGCIGQLSHIMNETRQMRTETDVKNSGWNHSILFSFADTTNIISLAPIFSEMGDDNVIVKYEQTSMGITYRFSEKSILKPYETMEFCSIWGIGYDEVAAATSAKELLRRGYEWEYTATVEQLDRMIKARDCYAVRHTDRIRDISNLNAMFSYFYATGRTIDTEEAVMITTRSTRYYVSAAYWDRDALLWAFPCILEMNSAYARELLMYVFGRQRRNLGMHSRYIDGTLLEPGFELDELSAPLYALTRYCEISGDYSVMAETDVKKGIESILAELKKHRDAESGLYDTFLLPSDDVAENGYVTYDNALLAVVMERMAALYERIGKQAGAAHFIYTDRMHSVSDDKDGDKLSARISTLYNIAATIRKSISRYCIAEVNQKLVYVWSTDLRGKYRIYDEPPGSLQLLRYYGYCTDTDEAYFNTMSIIKGEDYRYSFSGKYIDETGCAHAEHPWILSLANSLLCGDSRHALELLQKMNMDDGIACESVYENDGDCATGEAFATCAGFLSYAVNHSNNSDILCSKV